MRDHSHFLPSLKARVFPAGALAASIVLGLASGPAKADLFTQLNLVTDDQSVTPALLTDPLLINPWGVSHGPGGPFWVSDNGTGVTTFYSGAGAKLRVGGSLGSVTVPPPASSPTGQVFNSTMSDFLLTPNTPSTKAVFLFATENGTIAGWNPNVNLGSAVTVVPNPGAAVYKGITIGQVGNTNFLYAANFHDNTIDVFDTHFTKVKSFFDPGVPSNYAPFNVQNVNGRLIVTFAQQDSDKHDDVAGAGHGLVAVLDPATGAFTPLVAFKATELNSPWGLEIAPAGFGQFANDLLVGNFGNGEINAFDPISGAFRGTLLGLNGQPLVIGDLWALIAGDDALNANPNAIYFTAGVVEESHGLFGELFVPEPASAGLLIVGLGLLGILRRRVLS